MTNKTFVLIIIIVFVILSLIISFGILMYNEHILSQKNQNFLISKQPHNEKIVFYDYLCNTVSFGNIVVDLQKIDGDKLPYFLYVHSDSIFFSGKKDGDKQNWAVYKADFQLQNITEIFKGGRSYFMPDEDTIIFEKDNSEDKYVYYISENKIEVYDGDSTLTDNQSRFKTYSSEYYILEKNVRYSNFKKTKHEYTITNRVTGEQRSLSDADISDLGKIYPLNEYNDSSEKPTWIRMYLHNDKIYALLYLTGVVLLYEYDFETEKFIYIDWHHFDMSSDEIDVFFIE